MSIRIRLRRSWWHLRKAVRILWQPAPRVPFDASSTADWHTPPTSDHPSTKCTCGIPPHGVAHADHFEGCPWLALRCRTCEGDGTCIDCGGDGVARPDGDRLRTVREVKEWCLESLMRKVAEFGAEHALRNIEEAWFGRAEDPDGRPLHPVRDEPVVPDPTEPG